MDLGLIKPSWATLKHIAIMEALCETESSHALNPYYVYYCSKELKDRLTNRRLFTSPLPHEGVVINYPNNPAELLSCYKYVHDHFYKVGTEQEFSPAPCPINEITLAALSSTVPIRVTHSSLLPSPSLQSYLNYMYNHFYKVGTEQEFTPAPCHNHQIIPIAVKAKPKAKAKGRAKGKHASNATKKTPPTMKRPAGNFKRPAGKRTRKAT